MRTANWILWSSLLMAPSFAVLAQEQTQDEHAHHHAAASKPAAETQAKKPEEHAADAHAHHHDAAATASAAHVDTKVVVDEHIPPDPPQHPMAPMSDAEMTRVMAMDDTAKLFMFKLDTFERAKGDEAYSSAWNAQAWYGSDFDKLLLRSEGEREHGKTDARVEAFWNHAFASFWDWQLGLRHDFGSGPSRDWAAFGVQGLAPYWFEIEAAAYLGDGGRTAFGVRAEYELLLTQRLILQPEVELNFYTRNDRTRGVASGLGDAELGLRLRYEIRREFAPYIGVVRKYRRNFEADGSRFEPIGRSETQVVAGLRLWF
ncbi:copper resistance protein B [Rudaea sp.]|uniref:copper resistance protein B n=1 Tax=Rudaea sp. TaxID=2136325 RepID=UPI002ED3F331